MNWNDFKRQGKEIFPPKTILSILAGTAILAFGMVNIHKRVHITEGGVLGMILLLNYWFAIPTSLLPPFWIPCVISSASGIWGKNFLSVPSPPPSVLQVF